MEDYLYDYQRDAVRHMHNGCVLVGGVGSGKSMTSLAYYFESYGGRKEMGKGITKPMENAPDLVIITTAKKRESHDWERELMRFDIMNGQGYTIDSWQNIKKYKNLYGCFFIFDEDHLVGSGSWVRAFYRIARANKWVVLSATPADSYIELMPIFIASGFYKNKTEFIREHVVYDPFCTKFPKIKGYKNTGRLIRLKDRIIVKMKYEHESQVVEKKIDCDYDVLGYKALVKNRWNIWKDKPMENASEFCYCLRRFVNSDESRVNALIDILKEKRRVIVFYSHDYELEILKSVDWSSAIGVKVEVAELNGHAHDELPDGYSWLYLVNYAAGSEAWECTTTDTIVFYSQTYSYKTLVQAKGRIDRLTTPFQVLYYYHLVSGSKIDIAIGMALSKKKKFNETLFSGSCDFGG